MGLSFECGLCGKDRMFPDTLRVYDTPEAVRLIDWPCWCWSCQDLSLAEFIPDPAEVIAEARAWRARDREHDYRIACGPMGWQEDEREASTLAYYDSVLVWRLTRRSPSRCLQCGSVMVSLSASLYGRFEHPGCGGMFRCSLSICCGIGRMTREVYSSEGIKLAESQVVA